MLWLARNTANESDRDCGKCADQNDDDDCNLKECCDFRAHIASNQNESAVSFRLHYGPVFARFPGVNLRQRLTPRPMRPASVVQKRSGQCDKKHDRQRPEWCEDTSDPSLAESSWWGR